jgi:hypothetical protein
VVIDRLILDTASTAVGLLEVFLPCGIGLPLKHVLVVTFGVIAIDALKCLVRVLQGCKLCLKVIRKAIKSKQNDRNQAASKFSFFLLDVDVSPRDI